MASLDERYEMAAPVLRRLGRADADGRPAPSLLFETVSPDFGRLVNEACFGYLWGRPELSVEQRSLVTMAALVPLRRDENLRGHLLSGLDVGYTPEQIIEIIIQTHFYVGAPISTSALRVALDVFKSRDIVVEPIRVFDTSQDVETLRERGRAMRLQVLGDEAATEEAEVATLTPDWGNYELEYNWGFVWTRPGLDLQSRCLATLSALAIAGPDEALQRYVRAALRTGLNESQVMELFFHMTFYIGTPAARRLGLLAKAAMQHAT